MLSSLSSKKCTSCGVEKPLDAFYPVGRRADKTRGRRRSTCGPCCSEYNRGRYGATYFRERKLANEYGLTPEGYQRIYEEQAGRCAICGDQSQSGSFVGLQVDHDHETGEIRGLLCGKCNKGIGLLGDTLEGLLRAVAYLKGSE